MHGESSSNIYQKKFQCSMTSLVSTGKSQTFEHVFLENMILQLLLFKNLRQYTRTNIKLLFTRSTVSLNF